MTWNFNEFHIYDMNLPEQVNGSDYTSFTIDELSDNYDTLKPLMYEEETSMVHEVAINTEAGKKMKKIAQIIENRALYSQGEAKVEDLSKECLHDINVLTTSLMVCMFGEDYEIFGDDAFTKFIAKLKDTPASWRYMAIKKLFKVIGTPIDQRNPVDAKDYVDFDYINLPIFKKDFKIDSLNLDDEFIDAVVDACHFNWAHVSPIVIGSIFENVMDPEKRKKNGMHYTLTKYIHWVIKPAFLNKLNNKFEEIVDISNPNECIKALEEFQDELADFDVFDPTCGSGNFIIESYKQICLLEKKVVDKLKSFKVDADYKVSISHFHGIEYEELAAMMAIVCGWMAECQINNLRGKIYHASDEYINVVQGSALTIDWNTVVPNTTCNAVVGNFPFSGSQIVSKEQKAEQLAVFGKKWASAGKLDYATPFAKVAGDYINGTDISTSVIMTSSVHQGIHPGLFWKPMIENGCSINWGYRPFKWEGDAQVMCTITSFTMNYTPNTDKVIYEYDVDNDIVTSRKVKHINPYMIDGSIIGDLVFIENDETYYTNALHEINYGKAVGDGGIYTFSNKEKEDFIHKYPEIKPYLYRFVNGSDVINEKEKYYLLLNDCPSNLTANNKAIEDLIAKVAVKRGVKRDLAKYTKCVKIDDKTFIFPTCSTSRDYIPMTFGQNDLIITNQVMYIKNIDMWEVAILMSEPHHVFMDAVCGRLKDSWRYSKIVYNNLPIPKLSDKQKQDLAKSAQNILDARANHSGDTLYSLYKPGNMPLDLLKAHEANDKLVRKIYGIKGNEAECLEKLFEMCENNKKAKEEK